MFGSHSYIGSKSRIDKGFVHPVEFLTTDLVEVVDFGGRALYATFLRGIATKVVVCPLWVDRLLWKGMESILRLWNIVHKGISGGVLRKRFVRFSNNLLLFV